VEEAFETRTCQKPKRPANELLRVLALVLLLLLGLARLVFQMRIALFVLSFFFAVAVPRRNAREKPAQPSAMYCTCSAKVTPIVWEGGRTEGRKDGRRGRRLAWE